MLINEFFVECYANLQIIVFLRAPGRLFEYQMYTILLSNIVGENFEICYLKWIEMDLLFTIVRGKFEIYDLKWLEMHLLPL